MTFESTQEQVNQPLLLFAKSLAVILLFGALTLTGAGFYFSSEASVESIVQAAEDECMKAHILSHKGMIKKSTLWDYETDCDSKRVNQKQIEAIKD